MLFDLAFALAAHDYCPDTATSNDVRRCPYIPNREAKKRHGWTAVAFVLSIIDIQVFFGSLIDDTAQLLQLAITQFKQ